MNHIAAAIVIVALIVAIIYCTVTEYYWLAAFFALCMVSVKAEGRRNVRDR